MKNDGYKNIIQREKEVKNRKKIYGKVPLSKKLE
jgi:hypothetical protein|tara:strand:- start:189 stop:290 length:102 start_codon:yes stop_codon:yes gene_type:complete